MRVRVTQTLRLGPGTVLTLSERQADSRRHLLEYLGDGNRFRALAEVCFKAGEEIGVDGDLPKTLVDVIEVAGTSRPMRRKAAAPAALIDPARLDIG
jgi:hypothetical protein